jgi:hypothetical protein
MTKWELCDSLNLLVLPSLYWQCRKLVPEVNYHHSEESDQKVISHQPFCTKTADFDVLYIWCNALAY